MLLCDVMERSNDIGTGSQGHFMSAPFGLLLVSVGKLVYTELTNLGLGH